MSTSNEDLGDKAKKKAKEFTDKAKKASDKIEEEAREFAQDAKEASQDFTEGAKKAADDFQQEAKGTFDASNPDAGKNVAIIAHITIIGWVIALIMNGQNRTEIGSFYIRQVLGIGLLGLVLSWIPLINIIGFIVCAVLWIISLIGAINESYKPVYFVGDYFQNWFKSL